MSFDLKRLLNCDGKDRQKPPLDASHTTINNERWDCIPSATPEADKPSLICAFEQLLAARFPKSTPQIYRYFMKTGFQFCHDATHQHDAAYHYKTILRFENEAHKKEFETQHTAPHRLPHVLAIGRTAYNTRSMPVDVQVHLAGLQYKREVRLGVYQNIGASLRDDVLAATSYMPSGDRPKMLLTRALICEEPLTNTVFGSVEAIGFDSTHFFKSVAKRAPDSAIGKYQRLLGIENCWYGITPQASINDEDNDIIQESRHERHVESAIPIYFLVPISYKYTGLLTSVHTYLAMQRLRKQLGYDVSPELVDPSVYELPRGSADVLFAYSDLHAVVEFIDERLVNAHPTFHPFSLQLTIEPFVAESWRAVEEERFAIRNTLSSLNEHMQPADPTMGCDVDLVVYYAFFEGDCAPAHTVEHDTYDDNSSSVESKYTPRRLFGTPFMTPQTSQPTTSRTKIFDSETSETIVDGYARSNGTTHKPPLALAAPAPSKSTMLREKFVAMQMQTTAREDDDEESETTDQASSFALPNAIPKNSLYSAISSTDSRLVSASQNATNSSEYEKTTIRLSSTSSEVKSEFKRTIMRANQRLRSLTTGLTTSDDDNAASSPDTHFLTLPKAIPRSVEPDVGLEKTPARKNVQAIVMDVVSDETSAENLGVFKLDK